MSSLNPSEISDLIKQRIEQFDTGASVDKEGSIISVQDGIVRIHGLKQVMQGEMLLFENGQRGIALNLEQDAVGAAVLGVCDDLAEGQSVKCTGKVLEVPVGESLLGRVLDGFVPIDGKGSIDAESTSPVEVVAPGVIARQSVDQPLQTGIKSIDTMVPIGRGQRELIIGDRQTGKTAIAIDTIINQRDTGVKCIYVAVGQKASSVASVVHKLEEHDALKHTIIVAANASDSCCITIYCTLCWLRDG